MRLSIKGTQKTRLTGMQNTPSIAVRFDVLHTQGINMIAKWLDGAVRLDGIDLYGNTLNQALADMSFCGRFLGVFAR